MRTFDLQRGDESDPRNRGSRSSLDTAPTARCGLSAGYSPRSSRLNRGVAPAQSLLSIDEHGRDFRNGDSQTGGPRAHVLVLLGLRHVLMVDEQANRFFDLAPWALLLGAAALLRRRRDPQGALGADSDQKI